MSPYETAAGAACDLPTGMCGPAETAATTVEMTYVTDPICSACWAMEPGWRAARFHLGRLMQVRHVYGGLVPSWRSLDGNGGVNNPGMVATHWREVARHTGQALNASVWASDPIESSYPPSLVLMAAREVAPALEETFLRRLREELFIHGRNIGRPAVWQRAARRAGLDPASVDRALTEGRAQAAFTADLRLSHSLRIASFPTLILKSQRNQIALRGLRTFEQLVAVISEMAGVFFERSPVSVSEAVGYLDIGTTAEYATLLNLPQQDADSLLRKAGLRSRTLTEGEVWIP